MLMYALPQVRSVYTSFPCLVQASVEMLFPKIRLVGFEGLRESHLQGLWCGSSHRLPFAIHYLQDLAKERAIAGPS